MTQDQYVEAMLKVAYSAGCEVAQQDAEKEAEELAGTNRPIPRPNIKSRPQTPRRGENPGVAQMLNRNAPAPAKKPVTRFKQPGPRMAMGGRTQGTTLRNQQPKVPTAIAGR